MDKTSANAETAQPQIKPDRRGAFTWLLWFFVLLFGYVLSVGPVAKFCPPGAHPAIYATLEVVYKPLELLTDNCPPVESFFYWYLGSVWKVEP